MLVTVAFDSYSPAATLIVSNAKSSGPGSFRQALLDANATSDLDTIVFQIPGTGLHTISPASALPVIESPVVIDGATQPGFSQVLRKPMIELNGANAGASAGLRLLAGGSTIRGLTINRFGGHGLDIEGGGTNVIQGNFIGTDASGSLARANQQDGVLIYGSLGNIIGGTNDAERNVISGNKDAGIYVLNGGGAVILGNYIGTASSGNGRVPNLNNGIAVYNSPSNLVGGATAGSGNVISGNNGSGVYLFGIGAAANRLQGNFIGTDASGGLMVSNRADGITAVGAPASLFGGPNAGEGNLISGNGQGGIYLDGDNSSGTVIQGNIIGADITGTRALGNRFAGITLSRTTGTRIGGDTLGARNLISANAQSGVLLSTNSAANLVQGNFIGLDATGTNRLGNRSHGITLDNARSNIVGGASLALRNVISGNGGHGIFTTPFADGNWIMGNYIGTDAAGTAALPNLVAGLRIESVGNLVGGTVPGTGNLISGNRDSGIWLVGDDCHGNLIHGNYIGTDASGSNAVSNGRAGVGISDAPQNTVGGIASGAGNVISANRDAGIFLVGPGATGNRIQGNLIGTDTTGTVALGNNFEGIYLEDAVTNFIGGAESGAGNLVSGNNTRGIFLQGSSWNVLQGNWVGTARDGVSNLGNRYHGIECTNASNYNLIGGEGTEGNRVAFSKTVYVGVRIRTGASNDAILGNSIFSNGALGIDLGDPAGISANDPCDADNGANQLQNYPVLAQAFTGNMTAAQGELNSSPGAYRVQFFASPAADPTGYGEGLQFVGETTVVVDNTCKARFTARLDGPITPGWVLTATATSADSNTSEFSKAITVFETPILTVLPSPNDVLTLSWSETRLGSTNSVSLTTPGLTLAETESLAAPFQWRAVTNEITRSDGLFILSLPLSQGGRFFRLSFE